jgi:hypothetical protein
MRELTVSQDQAEIISQAGEPLVVVDGFGRMLGHLTPAGAAQQVRPQLTADELAEIKRRMQSPAPGLTTDQVLNYLASLESA